MANSSKSKRRHRRVAKRISALINANGTYGQGHIKNLSREGLFVRTQMAPESGTAVIVRFETLTGQKIEVAGTVRWSTASFCDDPAAQGFGMRIDTPPADYLEFFKALAKS